jgi:hypothetical protein
MLMRNQMILLATNANLALPGLVASFPQTRAFVIKHSNVVLTWRAPEQREKE